MLRKFSFTALLIFAVSIVLTQFADANPRRGRRQHQRPNAQIQRPQQARHHLELTEEQRTQIREKVTELRENGADREEIRSAVAELLKSFGVEVPDRGEKPRHGGMFLDQLTEEQQAQIKEKVVELKEAGADREEIRAAIGELLKSFGVEVPDRGDHHRGRGHGRFTEEQMITIRQMAMNGATREEIFAAMVGFAEIDAEINAAPITKELIGQRFLTFGEVKTK